MSKYLETECGKFLKESIDAVKLQEISLPTSTRPRVGVMSDFTKIYKIWRIEISLYGKWHQATYDTMSEHKVREAHKKIMQELQGTKEE